MRDGVPLVLLAGDIERGCLEFGRNHRFGRLALPPPDDQCDSLTTRLTDDLDRLKADSGLEPQLVVLSGDLTEWGVPRNSRTSGDSSSN